MKKKDSKIIIYSTKDGQAKIEVKLENETVWLTQKQLAELFDCSVDNISLHLKNIYNEGELEEKSVTEEYSITASDGKNYQVKHYNLDAIISVGYRINSLRGTQFRIWATQKLKEYIIKGFVLDDERLKQGDDRVGYFQELLERVRDIRSSERNFYQKVTDIYTTSVDYKKDSEATKQFFATVQNKMHYAVHGHTAAEIVMKRANSKKPLMGLTNFKRKYVTMGDAKIAKNYLSEKEIKQLNLIVSLYLDFAELQASNERAMTMVEWISKLDEFLKLSEKKLLTNAGSISAKKAEKKAEVEFEKYRQNRNENYVSDFDREVKKILKKK